MKFAVLSLFPDMITQGLSGLVGSAKNKGLYELKVCDLREFGKGIHKALDDEPYGGGDGMLMQPQPILEALNSIKKNDPDYLNAKVIYLSPKGQVWHQRKAQKWASDDTPKILICGRYAGLDQRFIDQYCDEEISIGDYVLNGGELASLVILESVIRLKEGTLGNSESVVSDSLSDEDGLLEAPQYTRPKEWEGLSVPDVLMSGHHENIKKWKRRMALLETAWRRPDLLTEKTFLELKELFESKDSVAKACFNDFGLDKVQKIKEELG